METEHYLNVLPRVADFLALSEFSASIQLNRDTRAASANGDVVYVPWSEIYVPPRRDVDQCTPGATMGALLNVEVHMLACSGLVMQDSLLGVLAGLTRAVRLRVYIKGGRLDVLVHALGACGNPWRHLTELEIFVHEVASFPCARDPLPYLLTLNDIRAYLGSKPWPALQRASVHAEWTCTKCAQWCAAQGGELGVLGLEGARWTSQWTFPIPM